MQLSASAEVGDVFLSGVGTASAGESVAGMRAGAAEEKSANRSFVTRPIEDRAHGEELIESEFAVEDVAASESVDGFEIARRDDLHRFDDLIEVGRMDRERFENIFGEDRGVIAVPRAVFELVGGELNVDGGDVLAFGGERRIKQCRNGDIEIGRLGNFAVFRGVVGALEVVDFVADV